MIIECLDLWESFYPSGGCKPQGTNHRVRGSRSIRISLRLCASESITVVLRASARGSRVHFCKSSVLVAIPLVSKECENRYC